MIEQVPGKERSGQHIQMLNKVILRQSHLPSTLKLHNRMMGRPSLDWLQYPALVHEWTKWRVSDCMNQIVSVSRRIREIILPLIFMHPRSFEEPSIMLTGMDRVSISIVDYQFVNVAIERTHIVCEFRYPWTNGRFVSTRLHRLVSLSDELPSSPALELSTPYA